MPDLYTATKQELLNYVIGCLMKQGRASTGTSNTVCLYRSSEGRKCAIGWLIPDDQYDVEYESICFSRILVHDDADWIFDLNTNPNISYRFLSDLQTLHDEAACDDEAACFLDALSKEVIGFCKKFNLGVPPSVVVYLDSK